MPPDIMVNLVSLPAPAGMAPSTTIPGKAATGPPGTDSLNALFASLLAQSSAPPGNLPKITAALVGKPIADTQKVGNQKTDSQNATGKSKTMDTAPVRASLLPEKKSTTGGELLLPKAQADVPAASPPLPALSTVLLSSVVLPMPAVLGPVFTAPVLASVALPVTGVAVTRAKASAGMPTTSPTPLLAKAADSKIAEPKTLAPVPSAALGFPVVALSASIPQERVVLAQGVTLPRTFAISQVISQSPAAAARIPTVPNAPAILAVPTATAATKVLTVQSGPVASPAPSGPGVLSGSGVLTVPMALDVQSASITMKLVPALPVVTATPAKPLALGAQAAVIAVKTAPVALTASNVQPLPNVQTAALLAVAATDKPAAESNPVSSGENAIPIAVGTVLPTAASPKPVPNATTTPLTVSSSLASPAAALPTLLPTTAENTRSVSLSPVMPNPVMPNPVMPNPVMPNPVMPNLLTANAVTANVVPEMTLLNVSGGTAEKELPSSPQNTLKSAAPSADTKTVKNTGSIITRAKATAEKLPTTDAVLPVTAKSSIQKESDPKSDPNAALTGTVATTITAEAAKTEMPSLTSADRTAIVRQVTDSVGTMPMPRTPGTTEQMTLQLHPKDWGKLHISVTLTPGPDAGSARTVTAHIVADTPQVKAALESGKGELHQTLREAGLKLEHLTVSVKPAEVKATSESAASGMPFDQSRQGAGSGFGQGPGQGSAGQGASSQSQNTSGGASSGTPSFASFSGGFQGGRQGQPTTPYAGTPYRAEPEPDIASIRNSPVRPAIGRIDLHA